MDNQNIKEILDNFKIYEDRYKKCNETQFIIFYRDIHLLLDYITNLQEEIHKKEAMYDSLAVDYRLSQEENERLKKEPLTDKMSRIDSVVAEIYRRNREQEDYKSRNEKAKSLTNRTIEIIKQQPSGNDEWILERLNGINYCLGGDEE